MYVQVYHVKTVNYQKNRKEVDIYEEYKSIRND